MAPALVGMPVEHARAFARILSVTRAAWHLNEDAESSKTTNTANTANSRKAAKATNAAQSDTPSRRRRTAHLAELAARAFEAQVMALRCRQAFVG
ncbi:Transposase [Cupriavidus sp. H18C1]|jgi:hypothetical protein|uniref:Uncharacterized protein n=1 Tax=Cupriavidus cauae TaxID=2608999 RepID=A0A5M8AR84_9BURK|nr:hypothetical protein [Cupriavidus cauae]KAA6124595.1 hypothetical protein F1599_11880 [Cupriavidus cauae]UZN49782.1 hypothetical protein KZ686_03940 [Cupriavidus cauae]